jgi:ABC-type dipeptide/oligopeptide/nickel transport system permease component
MLMRYLLTRLGQAMIVILGASILVFTVAHLTGDPTYLMVDASAKAAEIEALRHKMGLDQPVLVQYWHFLSGALHGDFGSSLWQNQPALKLVMQRVPYTLQLAGTALAMSLAIAIPAGVISAVNRNRLIDRAVMLVALLGQCIPGFWLGLMLIMLFSVQLRLFPTGGSGTLRHLILPAISLAAYSAGRIARLTRSSMLDVLGKDYIRTAKAKGTKGITILLKHALRNAAIPIVTLLALDISSMLGGAVITETVFAWPGLGRLVVQAIGQRDFPLVQASIFFIATVVVLVNLLVDFSYPLLDPRVKYD